MLLRGTVIGTGRTFRDGQEQRLIWARKGGIAAFSDKDVIAEGEELRLVITLIVDGEGYWARLRTRVGESHIYIGPEVRDYRGRRRALGEILRKIEINEPVDLLIEGKQVTVQPAAY